MMIVNNYLEEWELVVTYLKQYSSSCLMGQWKTLVSTPYPRVEIRTRDLHDPNELPTKCLCTQLDRQSRGRATVIIMCCGL
jgi:hypothetical protein